MTHTKVYDVVIIGAGVTGTAALYALACYSNVSSIAIFEPNTACAMENSNSRNNSQTLHFGDTESNYDLAHALVVRDAAELMKHYVIGQTDHRLFKVTSKLLLGVGAEEVALITARFHDFKADFPTLQLVDRDRLAELEPNVTRDRDPREPVIGLYSPDGFAINYQRLAESFMTDALASGTDVDTFFGTTVQRITRRDGRFVIDTTGGQNLAKTVIVAAGPYSLLFAQAMGYAQDLAIMPVAGSFYFTGQVLQGKVYTVQTPELPFAAVHGDPDVVVAGQTRFGPTAKVVPELIRHDLTTLRDFLRPPVVTIAGILTMIAIMKNRVIAKFILSNLLYDLPVIGKRLFLKQARKIVPSLKLRDIKLGKNLGGLRPQVIDTRTRQMQSGESTITEPGIIFSTTPSPGASVSLANGERYAQAIIAALGDGYTFNQTAFDTDLRPAPVEAAIKFRR